MKKILLSGTFAIALVGIGAGAVLAQGGQRGHGQQGDRMGGPQRPAFAQLDANGDGVLTLEEIQVTAQSRFADADANGDGMLDVDELTAAAASQAAARVAQMIERKDANNDGMLSIEEMAPQNNRGQRDPARMFAFVDADENGEITQEEWDSAMESFGQRGGRGGHGGKNRQGGRN